MWEKRLRRCSTLILLLLVALVVMVFRDYGITWDERAPRANVAVDTTSD